MKGILDWKKMGFKNLVNPRNNDRKRAREYKKELEEMKKRIQTRPYLFEQVAKVRLNHHSFSVCIERALRNYDIYSLSIKHFLQAQNDSKLGPFYYHHLCPK